MAKEKRVNRSQRFPWGQWALVIGGLAVVVIMLKIWFSG